MCIIIQLPSLLLLGVDYNSDHLGLCIPRGSIVFVGDGAFVRCHCHLCSFVPSPLPVSDGFGHSLLLIIFSPVWQTTLFGTRRVQCDCLVLVVPGA